MNNLFSLMFMLLSCVAVVLTIIGCYGYLIKWRKEYIVVVILGYAVSIVNIVVVVYLQG